MKIIIDKTSERIVKGFTSYRMSFDDYSKLTKAAVKVILNEKPSKIYSHPIDSKFFVAVNDKKVFFNGSIWSKRTKNQRSTNGIYVYYKTKMIEFANDETLECYSFDESTLNKLIVNAIKYANKNFTKQISTKVFFWGIVYQEWLKVRQNRKKQLAFEF